MKPIITRMVIAYIVLGFVLGSSAVLIIYPGMCKLNNNHHTQVSNHGSYVKGPANFHSNGEILSISALYVQYSSVLIGILLVVVGFVSIIINQYYSRLQTTHILDNTHAIFKKAAKDESMQKIFIQQFMDNEEFQVILDKVLSEKIKIIFEDTTVSKAREDLMEKLKTLGGSNGNNG